MDLNLSLKLEALNKLTSPLKSATKHIKTLTKETQASKRELAQLNKTQNKLKSFQRLSNDIKTTNKVMLKHNEKLAVLDKRITEQISKREVLKRTIDAEKRSFTALTRKQVTSVKESVAQNKALMKSQQRIQQLSSEYSHLSSKIAKNNNSKSKQTKLLKLSRRERIKQYLALRKVRQELSRAGYDTRKLSTSEQRLKNQTASATRTLDKQKSSLDKLSRSQQKYNRRIARLNTLKSKARNVGQTALMAGAAVVAPLANSVNNFMTFEDAMIGVARQVPGLKDNTGKLTAEYDVWVKKIRDLSKELPMTTTQIADMVTAGARMDIPKNELAEYVRLTSQMGTAFDAENPAELAELYGKVAKNFKLTAIEGRNLADTINYLDDNAISKATGIIGFLNRVSGVAGIVKITDKNMAALGSTLQTLGAGEEDSARAVNAIFTRLAGASKKKTVVNGLSALGINPESIEKGMVTDAQKTLLKIIKAVNQLPESKRLGVIADLVGIDHTKTLAKLVSNTQEWTRQIELANSTLAKGSMSREFDTRMTALSAKWQIFKNKIFNVDSGVGGSLKETLVDTFNGIGRVLDKTQAWMSANPKLTATIIKFTAAIGAALIALSGLALAISFLSGGIALLLSPVGLVLAGIAVVGVLVYKNWARVKAFFGGFFEGLKEGLKPVIDAFSPMIELVKKAVHWFADLLFPAKASEKQLQKCASAGKAFGKFLAAGIDLATKPLQILMEGIKWVMDHLSIFSTTPKQVEEKKQAIKAAENAGVNKAQTQSGYYGTGNSTGASTTYRTVYSRGYAQGGYTGDGYKHSAAGIVHRGEYVMTKEATSRIGVKNLNILNYAKKAGALGLGLGLAGSVMAQPIQVDSHAPIQQQQAVQISSPMTVNITINASSGQDEQQIAQMVQRAIADAETNRHRQLRSRLSDRD